TNERKQMSTKTNFKRIALVAVAALGMGVLSSVPSQAVGNADLLVLATGTQNTMAASGGNIADSGTAATATFSYLAGAAQDTYTLVASLKSAPTGNTALPFLMVDTYSINGSTSVSPVDTDIQTGGTQGVTQYDTAGASNATVYIRNTGSAAGIVSAKFKVMISGPTVPGTYVVNIVGGPTADQAGSDSIPTTGQDVTITISGLTTTSSASQSKAQLTEGATYAGATGATGVDSSVAVAATASTTAKAVIRVVLATSSGAFTATESITVTTTVGSVGLLSGGTSGKSVVLAYPAPTSTGVDLGIYADGTSGTASIVVSTPSVTFAAKSVTFYSTTVSKIVATKVTNTLSLGSNAAVVLGKATDSLGNTVGSSTAVYAYSSNTAIVSDSGTACTYNSTYQIHECALTGVAAGTANITLRNSGTAGAASTVSSTEAISVTVNTNPAAALKMEFNKTSYTPGEKGTLTIWAVDSTGKPVGPQTLSNLINSSGMSTNVSFSAGTNLSGGAAIVAIPNTTVSYALAGRSPLNSTASLVNQEPVVQLTVYMPVVGGPVSVSATGGASLPVSGQVKVTATTTVTDNAAAALAAVTA
ncbi:MAG: hypothetical protein EBU96_10635, partial [Actinobacteria bacterium]|nr:hypothetical protein [Actinomycetota bacterium]